MEIDDDDDDDDVLAEVYFRGIKFSWIDEKSAKFAKIRFSENFMPPTYSIFSWTQT